MPITHCPNCRAPGGASIRAPSTRNTASATNGPSIEGIGVCSRLHR